MKRMVTMSVLLVVLLGMFTNIGFAAEMKKVMIFKGPSIASMAEYTQQALKDAGFVDQENVKIVQVSVSANEDPAQLTARVQAAAPDVLVNLAPNRLVFNVLNDLSMPIITGFEVEAYVNAEGMPTGNVTGVKSTLKDMVYNSYKFLQKVAPLKAGQQVVYLDNRTVPLITRQMAEDALQRLQIPLKAVVDTSRFEDWQQAILRYNDDSDVGWILMGVYPDIDYAGKALNLETEVLPWQREHLQKPSITYWESLVQWGMLCGFGIDLNEIGVQCGKMVARVLRGEAIQTIKAEYPQKTLIALNRKTATNLGIVFSMDVLNLANVIYDDYEGKQVIRK